VTSVSNIARDAMVVRQTVAGFFEVLVDTLLGFWLPAWKLKRATKQVAHPKFYFFDTGVVRAVNHRLSFPLIPEDAGALLETHLLGEIRAYLSYRRLDYPLSFWRSHDGVEVDVLCETPKGLVGIEIKAATAWRNPFSRGLLRLKEELKGKAFTALGIYRGKHLLKAAHPVYPVADFLKGLWDGRII
jgi:predicted AAA+ superfamily ATPase